MVTLGATSRRIVILLVLLTFKEYLMFAVGSWLLLVNLSEKLHSVKNVDTMEVPVDTKTYLCYIRLCSSET